MNVEMLGTQDTELGAHFSSPQETLHLSIYKCFQQWYLHLRIENSLLCEFSFSPNWPYKTELYCEDFRPLETKLKFREFIVLQEKEYQTDLLVTFIFHHQKHIMKWFCKRRNLMDRGAFHLRSPQNSNFRIGCSNGKKEKLDFLINVGREESFLTKQC